METTNQPTAIIGLRKEPSIDPVTAEGILASVTKTQKAVAKIWSERWGFYKQLRDIQEEEAQKIGFSLEEYRAALRTLSCKPEQAKDRVEVEPSPKPLPKTTSGMIGHRVNCTLEKFGRLVKTPVDYPTRPPLRPGQVYDPYKQTMIFLGSVDGDPISYKLAPTRCDVTDEMWARPQTLQVSPYQQLNNI